MILALPLIALIALFSFFPFIYSVFSVDSPDIGTLFEIMTDASTKMVVEVSFLYTSLSIFFAIAIGFRFARHIYFSGSGIKKFALTAVFLLWTIPPFIGIPLYRSVLYWGFDSLINTAPQAFFLTVTARIWIDVPISTMIAYAAISNCSRSQIELMKIEGGSRKEIARFLFKPMSRSTLISFSVLMLINNARDLGVPLMMTHSRPYLSAGFTQYGTAGATTTFGMFLKDSLTTLSNHFIAYAQSLFVTLLLLLLFMAVLSLKRGGKWPLLLPALVDLLFIHQPVAIVSAGFVLLILVMKPKNRFIPLLPLILTIIMAGPITPGLSIALVYLCVIRPDFASRMPARIWNCLTDGLLVLWAMMSLFVLFNFIKLVFSDPLYPPEWNEFSPFTLQNFEQLASDSFHLNIMNSIIIGLGAALITLFVVFTAAFSAHANGEKLGFLKRLLIFSMAITGMNTLIPLFLLFKSTGLINTLAGVILTVVNHSAPLAFILVLEDIKKIPQSYMDRARIEGASPMRTFFTIILPMIIPVSVVVSLKVIIDGWSSFIAPLMFITDQSKYPVSLRLFSYAGNDELMYPEWGAFAAGSLLSIIVLIAVVSPLRKWLIKGTFRTRVD